MSYRPHMLPKVRSEAIMRLCRGADTHITLPCTLRIASLIPGGRCMREGASMGCHLPIQWGKGTSTKVTDMAVASGCLQCHAILDGPDKAALRWLEANRPHDLLERMLNGLTETHALLIDEGLIIIPDAEFV